MKHASVGTVLSQTEFEQASSHVDSLDNTITEVARSLPIMPIILGSIQNAYVSSYLSDIGMAKNTHMCYNEVTMDASGGLTPQSVSYLQDVVDSAHTAGIKAGALINTSTFLPHVVSDHLVATANAIASLVSDYSLDFVVIDDENPSVTQSEMESYLHAIDSAIPNTEIVVATGWYEYKFTTTTFDDHVDYNWVMAYDMYSPADLPFHATYEDTVTCMIFWEKGGYTASKLLMGIPLYAKDHDGSLCTFRTIVNDFAPDADADFIRAGTVSVGFSSTPEAVANSLAWYGGQTTNRRKIDFCRQRGYAGVGLFDSAQDLPTAHSQSLLAVIANEATVPLLEKPLDEIHEGYISVDDSDHFEGNRWIAQTFTPSTAHIVNRVSLSLNNYYGATASIIVGLRTAYDGTPSTSDVRTATVPITDYFSGHYHRVSFDFGQGMKAEAGSTYALVMRCSNSATIYYKTDVVGSYSGGKEFYDDGGAGTAWTALTGYDIWFEEGYRHPVGVASFSEHLPAPSAKYQGKFHTLAGTTGVRDYLYICLKSTAGNFSWVEVTNGGTA